MAKRAALAEMLFNDKNKQAMVDAMWKMCEGPPKQEDTPFSKVYIHTGVAKEFEGVDLSEWVQALDDKMSIACVMAVRDLKLWKEKNGADYLTWDKVESVFNNCDYIVKDEASSKRINQMKSYDETNWFKVDGSPDPAREREIITWFKDLFNKAGEQDILDNSVIVQNGTLDRLAAIASETGARVKDFESFFAATDQKRDKVMEIGVIRFPRKGDAKIKLYRLVVFAFFQSSRVLMVQHDQAGVEVEYNSVEFKPYTASIDTQFAEKAKEKLSDPDTFDF